MDLQRLISLHQIGQCSIPFRSQRMEKRSLTKRMLVATIQSRSAKRKKILMLGLLYSRISQTSSLAGSSLFRSHRLSLRSPTTSRLPAAIPSNLRRRRPASSSYSIAAVPGLSCSKTAFSAHTLRGVPFSDDRRGFTARILCSLTLSTKH